MHINYAALLTAVSAPCLVMTMDMTIVAVNQAHLDLCGPTRRGAGPGLTPHTARATAATPPLDASTGCSAAIASGPSTSAVCSVTVRAGVVPTVETSGRSTGSAGLVASIRRRTA